MTLVPTRRGLLLGGMSGLALSPLSATGSALAQSRSSLSPRPAAVRRATARLVGGAVGSHAAGLEIVLDPGFKTYWRHPGESGLPPAFDWSGSQNVAAVAIGWPAPHRIEDAAGIVYGYKDRVVLPLDIRPADPALPVTLRLRLDYGVCRDICIPERADLVLDLSKAGSPDEIAAIAASRREVPDLRPLGSDLTPAIVAVERSGSDKLAVTVRVAPGAASNLFVEAPEPWFLLARRAPVRLSRHAMDSGELARFDVDVLQRDGDNELPPAVTLTLVAGDSVETPVRLDAALLTR